MSETIMYDYVGSPAGALIHKNEKQNRAGQKYAVHEAATIDDK